MGLLGFWDHQPNICALSVPPERPPCAPADHRRRAPVSQPPAPCPRTSRAPFPCTSLVRGVRDRRSHRTRTRTNTNPYGTEASAAGTVALPAQLLGAAPVHPPGDAATTTARSLGTQKKKVFIPSVPGGVASKNRWVYMRVQGGFISYSHFVFVYEAAKMAILSRPVAISYI